MIFFTRTKVTQNQKKTPVTQSYTMSLFVLRSEDESIDNSKIITHRMTSISHIVLSRVCGTIVEILDVESVHFIAFSARRNFIVKYQDKSYRLQQKKLFIETLKGFTYFYPL